MPSRLRVFDSSIGTKLLIGSTGILLFLYLILHIAGNAIVFLGPETFNGYSHFLLSNPLIYPIEIALVLVFLVHVYKAVAMTAANRGARPVAYAQKKYAGAPSRKTIASSTMILSGLWLLLFIVLHVRTFKFGAEYEAAGGVRDLYRLEMENFSNPLTVAFYVVSMLVVGSHLWHGVGSSFQSLGIDSPAWTPRILAAGKIAAVVIAGGFIVIAIWAFAQGTGA
jgi:succinate dehydrogenase / fumarate reductase cytochrome b subunit